MVERLYKPFVDLIRNDGYRVRRATGPISAADLSGVDIFVVAIAMGFQEGQKTLPGLRHGLKGDAFSPAECSLLAA